MPTITVEMVRVLNQRLQARGSLLAIAEREYPDAIYDKNLIAEPRDSNVAPLLIDEIVYTNCGSEKQQVVAAVEKTLTNEVSWNVTFGTKVGWKLQFKAEALFLKASTEFSFEANLGVSRAGKETEVVAYKFQTPIAVPPMKRVTFQAVVQQEKVEDVPFTVMVFLKGGEVAVTPIGIRRLRRYYNGTEHFYTVNEEHPEDHGYTEETNLSPGYIFTTQAPGTVPLYRYFNGTEHFYTIDYGELGEGRHGFQKEGIAGYIYPVPTPDTVPLYRYYNGVEHFYTSDPDELGGGRFGYRKEGIAGYIIPTNVAEGGVTRDVTALLPDLVDRTFELRGTFRGESTVRKADILLIESDATATECKILAQKLGASFGGPGERSAAPPGLYVVHTPDAELVGRAPQSPAAKANPDKASPGEASPDKASPGRVGRTAPAKPTGRRGR